MKEHIWDRAAVLKGTQGLCSWTAIPAGVLKGMCSGLPPSPGDPERPASDADDRLQRLCVHLADSVPLEWRVEAGGEQPLTQPALNAQAVSTPGGVFCLGGRRTEGAKQVAVQHEEAWMTAKMGLADCSQVFQAPPPPEPSKAVTVMGVTRAGDWAAVGAGVQLPCGLHGHSAARYKDSILIFGGQLDRGSAKYIQPDRDDAAPMVTNKLRIYRLAPSPDQAVFEGTAFQEGQVPVARMLHRACVDEEAGVMYVFGGVRVKEASGGRLPADKPGWLHALDLDTFRWQLLQTTGAFPATTTLLAMWCAGGCLWAIPDANPASPGASYRLHRLRLGGERWEGVGTRGPPPPVRSEACAVCAGGRLLVYGGSTPSSGRGGASVLSDLHSLQLDTLEWAQLQPVAAAGPAPDPAAATPAACCAGDEPATDPDADRISDSAGASTSGRPAGGRGLAAVAGHAGGAYRGALLFFGGYRDAQSREAVRQLQVLYQGVRPATGQPPGVAALPAALQHCRQRLARLLSGQDRRTVVLMPEGGKPVSMPVLLLAAHSPLFADMLEDVLDGGEAGDEPQRLPLPGVPAPALAVAVRWLAGLASLEALTSAQLVDVFRVADRLILEGLMSEALQRLLALPMEAADAPPLMQLASSLPGRDDVAAIGERAQQLLQQQVTPDKAADVMQLAQLCGLQDVRTECIKAMYRQVKSDLWAAYAFACRFNVTALTSRCLRELQERKGERLLRHVNRAAKLAHQHGCGGALDQLSRELLSEFRQSASRLGVLPQYVDKAETCKLSHLWRSLVGMYGDADEWDKISGQRMQLDVLRAKCPSWVAAVERSAQAGSAQTAGAAAAAKADDAPADAPDRPPLRSLQTADAWLQ